MPNRVTFLIDGFNVYHSIREGQDMDGRVLVWLDMKSLCESCLDILGRDAVLAEVWYFSAYAEHLTPSKPDVVRRHRTYVAALRNSGVQVEMGRFKDKDVWCPSCKTDFVRHRPTSSNWNRPTAVPRQENKRPTATGSPVLVQNPPTPLRE